MPAKLVVCADDYALNPGVSSGIARLAQGARISATSVMVCSPHWPEHALWLNDSRGQLGVGLHLDLTSPWALAAGHGRSLGMWMLRSALRWVSAAQARHVIEQQLDRFEQVWQARPDHIDGHQHVQQFPVWREALVQVVQQRYASGQRPWLRVSRPGSPDQGFKASLIAAMGAHALAQAAHRADIPCSSALLGITDFSADSAVWLRRATAWLTWAQAQSATVLMCHPGQPDPDAADGIATARDQEFRALSGDQWPELLRRHDITLTPGVAGVAT
ncbi:MAG: ChbG/HpnK family deacetylase [Alphaproteobacteria bacterium]|nr:ChbG/HpnK family deacetylase [Alphaproteobacteria bacterium]